MEPDRVPTDIGGTTATCINVNAYENLKTHLGLPGRDETPETISRISLTSVPNEEILEKLDTDCRGLNLGSPDNSDDRDVDYDDGTFVDQWGVRGRRGTEEYGFYHDVDSTLRHDEAILMDLDTWRLPDPNDPGRFRPLREKAQELSEQNEYAIVVNLRVLTLDLIGFIRGSAQTIIDLMVNRTFYDAMINRLVDNYWLPLIANTLDQVGEYADVLTFADELAFQDRPAMSLDVYRNSALKPAHRRLIALMKSKSNAKVLFHCCGACYDMIGDPIDIGMDILNPVQVSSPGIDTARLKRDFGTHIVFWGAVDTHRVLPFGTPDGVKAEVKRVIEDLGSGGGLVLAPVHHIQADVPPENIVAMCEATHEHGRDF